MTPQEAFNSAMTSYTRYLGTPEEAVVYIKLQCVGIDMGVLMTIPQARIVFAHSFDINSFGDRDKEDFRIAIENFTEDYADE